MTSQHLIEAINTLQNIMNEEGINPTQGLPEKLFIFGTTLIPVSNVDLFITNEKGQVLLSWRDDKYYGKGWHIPGGCIRLRESWLERIQKTAVAELGTDVEVELTPLLVRESMTSQLRPWLKNQLKRTYNISMLFNCKLPKDYKINSERIDYGLEGYLKWFDAIPEDLLLCHRELYGDLLEAWFKEKREINGKSNSHRS